MHTIRNNSKKLIRRTRARRVLSIAVSLAAVSLALSANASLFAQSGSQLTIGKNTQLDSLSDETTSVVFNKAGCVLTLRDGQTLRPVLVSREANAVLKLGDGEQEGQAWSLVSNNMAWSGTIDVMSGNSLTLGSGIANPLGAYAENNVPPYGALQLYSGATLTLPARALGADSEPLPGETKFGALATQALNDAQGQENAVVDVGKAQTLTVENGLNVNSSVGLTKRGEGTLQFLANGTEKTKKNDKGEEEVVSKITSFDLGKTRVSSGTLRIADGTAKLADAKLSAAGIVVEKDATLDVQLAKQIDLKGAPGDVVFSAEDGSTVNLYVDKDGSTSFVAQEFNTYINVGAATLNVNSTLRGQDLPQSMTVFATQDGGQTNYVADKILVDDNLLGKNYIVDKEKSTATSLVLSLERSKALANVGKTPNERAVGEYLDKTIASDNYNDEQYAFLNKLERAGDALDLSLATGEIHASTVGFMYMNNLATTQSLFEHMRNNTLVGYAGDSAVAPMDYGGTAFGGAGGYPVDGGHYGGASNGAFDQGPLYYNNDYNSYAPGVVPINNMGAVENGVIYNNGTPAIYNGEIYGTGMGGASGGSFQGVMPNDVQAVPQSGDYNFGWRPSGSRATLTTMRGQAQYGDPGTLIYSAWFNALGGAADASEHKDAYGYNAKQGGFLTGLDLFGSCDCRFGAYYGYQKNELKNLEALGKLETSDHLIGIYHQFGDETVYNIATIRGGFDNYKTTRDVVVLGEKDTLSAKYDGWNAGASFERGANFAARPFVFSPYVSLDYNFFAREKFDETSANNTGYALHVGRSNYHSLRGQVGGRIALDMYPGSQQIRLVGRAAFIHEFLDPMYGETGASFIGLNGLGSEFNLYGNSLGREWGLVGAGLDWTPIPALALFLRGDYLFNKYVKDPYTSAGLKFRW